MAGDNPYSIKHHEIKHNSEINLLNVGDGHISEVKKHHEAHHHEQMNSQISAAHQTVMSIVDRLAAYYPNGHQGVLDAMVKGPAHDHVAAMLKRNETGNLA